MADTNAVLRYAFPEHKHFQHNGISAELRGLIEGVASNGGLLVSSVVFFELELKISQVFTLYARNGT